MKFLQLLVEKSNFRNFFKRDQKLRHHKGRSESMKMTRICKLGERPPRKKWGRFFRPLKYAVALEAALVEDTTKSLLGANLIILQFLLAFFQYFSRVGPKHPHYSKIVPVTVKPLWKLPFDFVGIEKGPAARIGLRKCTVTPCY